MSDGEHRNSRVTKLEQRIAHLERAVAGLIADLTGLAHAHNAIAHAIESRGTIQPTPAEPPSA